MIPIFLVWKKVKRKKAEAVGEEVANDIIDFVTYVAQYKESKGSKDALERKIKEDKPY